MSLVQQKSTNHWLTVTDHLLCSLSGARLGVGIAFDIAFGGGGRMGGESTRLTRGEP